MIKEKLNLNITDLDMNGLGIAHDKAKTYFVENALISEKVEAEIIEVKKKYIKTKSINILNKSEYRTNPLCPYFNECGGCDLQHLQYEKTLEFKQKQILLLLKKIANIEFNNDIEIIKSDEIYNYRNKLSMQIKNNENNISKLCYFKKNSHSPIFVDKCLIADKKFDIVINLVNNFLKNQKVEAYNEKTKKGYAKNIVARIIKNKLLLSFVCTKKYLPNIDNLYQNLLMHFDEVGINLNVNNKNKDILSNNFFELKGASSIEFNSFNIKQKINNASFLQVNFNIQEKLYKYVLENVKGLIVNTYSGAGLLTCLLAKNLNTENTKVIGIEINKNAVKLADELVKENLISNVENFCADASLKLQELNLNNYTLVLDPPRSGVDDIMINTILKQKPNKIVYISCSLNSLCKNLKEINNIYQIESIKGFDMFPQTKNLETVVILKRKE